MVTQRAVEQHEGRLTWAEICARYPDRWVVLVDIENHEAEIELRSAKVIAAFETRADATPTVKALLGSGTMKLACFSTGRLIPEGIAGSVNLLLAR